MKTYHTSARGIIVFIILAAVSGCAWFEKNEAPKAVPDNGPGNEASQYITALPPSEGSLWNNSRKMLFVDKRARSIGDTVIVDIVENTSSKIGANTERSGELSLQYDIDGLSGQQHINENLGINELIKMKRNSEFSAEGKSDRSGQITASIGARVTNVLPNGNVTIYGRREMKVNNELQKITVSGIIRPEDIGADNRVKSTYLADARIEYSGEGVLADKQSPGWGIRILDKVWPF